MNPIPAFAVLAGQLFGTAFAAGLNLYATVGLLGLASRFGWMPPLPSGLRGLENGLVIGSAVTLFVIEFVVKKNRYAAAVWDAIHTIVRPVAAALLAALALDAMPWEVKLAGGVASATVAFAAHSSQAGLRVILAHSRYRGRPAVFLTTMGLDLLAVLLAGAALMYPRTALVGVGAALALSILVGPRLWRAAAFGGASVIRRVARFFGRQGWTERSHLPRVVRRVVPAPAVGRSAARAVRAVAVGVPRAGAWRTGWLVTGDDGNAFIYQSFVTTRRIDLPRGTGNIDHGVFSDALRIDAGTRPYTLYLFKDGPSAEIVMMEVMANGLMG